jgi:cytochrome b6-f complex iron-sulfur subunit
MKDSESERVIKTLPSRRSFLNWLWFGLCAVVLAEVLWLIVSFLRPRKPPAREGGFGALIETGPVESFLLNSVTAFPRGHFYLSRLEDGGFLAISRRCTHLGCTVPWMEEEKKFLCPCHSSTFDIRGNVISSPASRALDIYVTRIENNIVYVNTGKLIKRTEFRKGQVTYPSGA